MKTIKIDEARQNQLLPQNIKNTSSDVMSNLAKKTLAVLLNYQLVNAKAQERCYVAISNQKLALSVGNRKSDVMQAVQELIELELINKKAGQSRTKDEKAMASEYTINIERMFEPIIKKTADDGLYSKFLKHSGTLMGTANPNANANANPNTNPYSNSNTITNTFTNSNSVSNNLNLKENNMEKNDLNLIKEKLSKISKENGLEEIKNIIEEFNKMKEDGVPTELEKDVTELEEIFSYSLDNSKLPF